MTTNLTPASLVELALDDLPSITGGISRADFAAIRRKAEPHCPQTVARYANLDPAAITRSRATRMGSQCLAEMGSFKAAFARPVIQDAIDTAFPRR